MRIRREGARGGGGGGGGGGGYSDIFIHTGCRVEVQFVCIILVPSVNVAAVLGIHISANVWKVTDFFLLAGNLQHPFIKAQKHFMLTHRSMK